MTEKKIDRRVRYTKAAIRESFLDLLEQKPIEKISVTEICKNADINRGTFYSHYSDPFELKASLEHELEEVFDEAQRKAPEGKLSALDAMRLLKENKSLCRLFCGPHGDMESFTRIITSNSTSYFYSVMKHYEDIPEPHRECLVEMMVAAVSALIKFWYVNDMKESPEVIAESLENFCIGGSMRVQENVNNSLT